MSTQTPSVSVERRTLLSRPIQLIAKMTHVTSAPENGIQLFPEICAHIWKKFTITLFTPWNYTFFQDSIKTVDSCDSLAPTPNPNSEPGGASLQFLGGGIYFGRISPILTFKAFSF